jgi:hypothetical protein
MKSTQIKFTTVLCWSVSTVFIEPFEYYETAVRDNESKDKRWQPREWADHESIAIAQHDETVRILGA